MDTPWKFRGIPWISIDLHGYSMDFHGFPWISMEVFHTGNSYAYFKHCGYFKLGVSNYKVQKTEVKKPT